MEIDWDHPGGILSPGCPHHPCLSIPGTRRFDHRSKSTCGGIKMAAAISTVEAAIFTILKQGNQRWQIPLPPHASAWQHSPHSNRKCWYFFRDVISLLARVVILLIDTATQEVPMKNIWKKLSVQFLRYAIELLHVKRRTCHKWR